MERLPISFGLEEAVLVLVIFDMIVSAIPSGTISTSPRVESFLFGRIFFSSSHRETRGVYG